MRERIGDRYRIIRSLGKGGMGDVYLADDVKLGRKVALKCIGADALLDAGSRARFQREAQAASRLDHPNICKIFGIANVNEQEFIIMQFVDGVTLDQLLKMKPLAVDKIIDIALQVTEGMIAAQSQNIVHLDLKPGNIMIDKNGGVRILDFSLAEFRPRRTADRKTRRPEPGLSGKNIVMGTAAYMSPEQLAGRDADGRSDIFSFGVVLYEMIENKNPFSTPDQIVTFYNIKHLEIHFSRDSPEALRAIVRKTVRKDREQRYGDFAAIKKDLLALRARRA